MKKQKEKPLKAGIIGCGRIGSLLERDALRPKPCTHAGGYDAHPEVTLIAGCDQNPEQLRKFEEQWEGAKGYKNLQVFLAQNPDIVSIAAWTENHYEILKEVCRSPSVKVILCEKPLAANTRQGREMVKMCKEAKKSLAVAHIRRWDPAYIKAKEIIAAGKLGKIKTIFAQTLGCRPPKLSRKKYTGGSFFHDGTHLVDILHYLCGSFGTIRQSRIHSPYGKDFIESELTALLRMKCGSELFMEGGGERNYFSFQIDIQGSSGRLKTGNEGQELFLVQESTRYEGFKELTPVPFPLNLSELPPLLQNAHTACVENIVRHIREGEELLSTGDDALETLRQIERIYRHARRSQKNRTS